jgi:polar amino acid transport system substrate-binding protein
MTRRAIAAIAVAVVTLAGGCASPPEAVSGRKDLAITTPVPISVGDPAPPATADSSTCVQSFQPHGLPAPGQMPRGSAMAAIHDRGRLKLGVGIGAYLLGFPNPTTGRLEGFEADIAREIAFAIFGVYDDSKIELHTLNANEREPAVLSGQVDLVLAAMTITCDRWKRVAFSTDYYTAGQRILVNNDSPVTSAADLGGKKVCASSSGTNIPIIQNLPAKPIAVGALNTGDCLLMLQQRQVDAVSTGDVILAGLHKQDPGSKIVGDRFTSESTGIAISPQSVDLIRFVNAILEKLKADGTWTRLQRQWLADELGPVDPPTSAYKPE